MNDLHASASPLDADPSAGRMAPAPPPSVPAPSDERNVAHAEPKGRSSRARVLVVDDDESVREMMAEALRIDGHEVTTAAAGEEALELVREIAFDVNFVDLVMPGINGLDVLKNILQLSPDADVVVVSGFATIEVAVESMRLGAADFVTKPFSNTHLQVVVSKVLERRRLIRAAREKDYYKRLSRLDGLTELYNHRFFHQLVDSEVARARRFGHKVSLLILDLDRFKEFNDRFGHPAGDVALKQVADLLRKTCRKYDFVARYGGEEFAIISPGAHANQASVLGERIRQRMTESEFLAGDQAVSLTLSAGIASLPDDATTKKDLLELADRALYSAKTRGRDRIVLARDLDP